MRVESVRKYCPYSHLYFMSVICNEHSQQWLMHDHLGTFQHVMCTNSTGHVYTLARAHQFENSWIQYNLLDVNDCWEKNVYSLASCEGHENVN